MRDMVFISHANPEDNEFTQWLALRLGTEGFPVWCDLTQLLGGETFWTDVEEAIRHRTIKFLFVLSRLSNHKPGAIQELNLALNVQRADALRDFVIPLGVDDLPPAEFNGGRRGHGPESDALPPAAPAGFFAARYPPMIRWVSAGTRPISRA